jgi:hypothetical protein
MSHHSKVDIKRALKTEVEESDFDVGPGRVAVAAARVGADIALREL